MKTLFKSGLVSVALLCSLSANAIDKYKYTNPVIASNFPDPTIIRDGKTFYAYHTGRKVPISKSRNLVTWTSAGDSFYENTRPTFVEGGGVWAPDINKIGDKFVMYYSMSTWGGEWSCGIGVATSTGPADKFTDLGKLFISSEIGVQNSIDPFYIEEEDGSKYLFWGSFRGIFGIQLSDDGLSLKEGAQKFQIAGTLTEGTYIHKHDGYYYLIGSAGTCCEGANSSYHLVVARSKYLKGPYTSKDGGKAMDNKFSTLLNADKDYVYGPGHCSEIVTDDAGQDWILYHGYQADNVDAGRCLYLDQIKWDSDGWPYISGNKNHHEWDRPKFDDDEFTYDNVEYIDYKGTETKTYFSMFDTGFVPTKATKVEVDCYSYPENEEGEPFVGNWRAVFSGRDNHQNGISLYVNPEGNQWGYFVGGYENNNLGTHEFETRYNVAARLADITINEDKFTTNRSNYTATHQRLALFSGQQDLPYLGRIYGVKVYSPSTKLQHEYVPCVRREDGMPMFHDLVTDEYIRPNSAEGFGVGDVVDAIKDINIEHVDDNLYDLQGRRIDSPVKRGIYIRGGKKVVLE